MPVPTRIAGALAAGALISGVLLPVLSATADRAPAQTPCGPIRSGNEAASRLHIAGTQMQDSDGDVVMPYGVSVVGGPQTFNWARTEQAAAAQIIAAHHYWHVNTIRIQVSETLLFEPRTAGRTYNAVLADSVDRLVCRIIKQGDIPVINDTTIFTGRERGPGERTRRFWRFMAQRYGNRLPVIFDLFNEPQLTIDRRNGRFLRPDHVWRLWRSGGSVSGLRYLGMQDLVNEIRVKRRVNNVIWAEEPYYLHPDKASLGLLPRHLLKGADIVYTFHKPNMTQSSRSFRDLRAVARQQIPLMDSEWGQFAATDRPWMCQPNAYRTAPPYLRFLRDSSIGMLVWSLQPGSLIKGVRGRDTVNDGAFPGYTRKPRDLSQPSVMKPDYGCTRAARGQGNGRLVMDYFGSYSRPAPAALFPRFG